MSGQPALLRRSVASLLARTDYAPFELLLTGGPAVETRAQPCRGSARTRGYACSDVRAAAPVVAAGAAMRAHEARSWCLLGLVEPIAGDWLGEMVSHALRPEIGAVGAKLYDQAGAIAHAGIILGAGGVAGRIYRGTLKSQARTIARLLTVQNYSAVTGACLVGAPGGPRTGRGP